MNLHFFFLCRHCHVKLGKGFPKLLLETHWYLKSLNDFHSMQTVIVHSYLGDVTFTDKQRLSQQVTITLQWEIR